jgi:hypothetical protein
MKLICTEGFLELHRSDADDWNSPSQSDILLNVTVDVSGYSAADQGWVVAAEWGKFLSELETLDERRQGSAVVEGASPDDLRLEFNSTDSAGHMAVQGHLGWHKSDGHFLQLRFGFSLEPDLLPNVVRDLRAFRDGAYFRE